MIEIILPYPPSVNNYKRVGRIVTTKSGKIYQHRYSSPKTKYYMYQVWVLCRPKRQLGALQGAISIEVMVYPPDKRKRDLDNICKVLLDSLQGAGMYDDDNQISRLLVERKEIKRHGQVIVRIEPCCYQNAAKNI